MSFHYRTFAKVALIPYIGGTAAHVLRLIYRLPLEEAPFWMHWGILLTGGYAVAGFIRFSGKINFKNKADKLFYGLVIFHLGLSVITHLYSILWNTNNWMGIFSMNYSYFALVYFVGLGVYCFLLGRRITLEVI